MFKKSHTKFSLRFKHWSRKSYAAFKSIGRQVTIGRLKTVVADTLLGKQKNILSIFVTAWANNNEAQEHEWDNPPDEELLLELSCVPVLQNTKTYGGFVKPHYIITIYLWLKAFVYKAFSFFYFNYSMVSFRVERSETGESHMNSRDFSALLRNDEKLLKPIK